MIKLLICGDYCPQDRVQDIVESANYKELFEEVLEYTSKADYSIVNLEAPVLDTDISPIEKCGPNLRCSSKTVEALKFAGFNMVTLANNHFYDYGDGGVKETLEACKSYGLDVVGGGMNIEEAAQTLYRDIEGVRVAFINCCEHEFSIATSHSGGSNPLNPIRQYYEIKAARENAEKVVVIVHGGHEHYHLPSPRMKEVYHFFIDAGADVVINHHQHCYSGYELYHGRPIFYGLGNFCFDRNTQRNSYWNQGYMVLLSLGEEVSFELIPYVQGNEKPGVHLLETDEKHIFENNIRDLNRIIADDSQLAMNHKQFMDATKGVYTLSLEPYRGRLLIALFVRKLLPSLISPKRRMQLLNYLQCESHIERLVYALKNKR